MQTILITLCVAGISLLWRTYRYDDENSFNTVLDALPYAIRKPLTCGLCFTFWAALLASSIWTPFVDVFPSVAMHSWIPLSTQGIIVFFARWFALGTLAVFVVYVIDTFYQISHYYKHAAHHN